MKKTITESAAAVMNAAHESARKIRRYYPEADYATTLAAALRNEWEKVLHPVSAADEWAALHTDPDALMKRLTAMVYYCARKDAAALTTTTTMTGQVVNERAAVAAGEMEAGRTPWINRFAWMQTSDDARACAHEAYIRAAEYMAEDRSPEKPLQAIFFKAVMSAAVYIDRQEKRHARALRMDETVNEDGSKARRDYIVDAPGTMESTADDPESFALFMDALESVCSSNEERKILLLWAAGYNEREIAQQVGKSRSAVWKAKERMKARRDEYRRAEA